MKANGKLSASKTANFADWFVIRTLIGNTDMRGNPSRMIFATYTFYLNVF